MQPHMGIPDSACVGQMLVQHGEVIAQNQAVAVSLPDSSFGAAVAARVPFPSTIVTTLVGNPGVTVMGPYDNDDASSEVVCVHKITVVPPMFVSALLARKIVRQQRHGKFLTPCVSQTGHYCLVLPSLTYFGVL